MLLARPFEGREGAFTRTEGRRDFALLPTGRSYLQELQEAGVEVPLVAIGGITIEGAPAVIGAGAGAVAVIADLLATGHPEARVREYLHALGASNG